MAVSDERVEELVAILETVPIFSGCSKPQLVKMAKVMEEKYYGANEYMTKQGEEGKNFFVIVEGKADIVIDGKPIGQLEKGDYCGEVALINDSKRTASVKVNSKSRVHAFCVSKTTFHNVLQKDMNLVFYRRQAIAIDNSAGKEEAEKKEDSEKKKKRGPKLTHPSKQEVRWLLQAVSKNALFAQLSKSEKKHIISQMHKEDIKRGEVLIREGENGNTFYVIRSGQFRVTSREKGHICYVATREAVGELALIYNAPRSATVTAMTNAILWAIDRATLRKHVKELSVSKNHQIVSFLKKVPLLKSLVTHEVHRVAGSCIEESFSPGQVIMNFGDEADKFYIIKTGHVEVYEGAQKKKVKRILSKGAYFGEKALLSSEPRSCTLISQQNCICYTMTSRQFTLLLGPLVDLMNRNMADLYIEAATKVKEKTKADAITQDLEELNNIGRIGVGGYGVVNLVRDPNTKQLFALKSVRKDLIVWHKQQKQIQAELKVMRQLDNLFVVNLYQTYQDRFYVYFLCDIGMAGDLFHYMHGIEHLSKVQVTFYSACIVEALEHIHSFDIVYRDIKPENVVICANGYLKLTDYGLAKFLDADLTFTLCGTPDYLAPETILGRGYDTGVDWWGLGILIYEMIAHVPPFMGSPDQICEKILTQAPRFNNRFTKSVQNLINKLCAKNPHQRLGNVKDGANAIRKHPYFIENKFDWEALQNLKLEAPHKPVLKSDDDLSNFKISLKPDPSKPAPVDDPIWAKDF